jgi:hypothetical protein
MQIPIFSEGILEIQMEEMAIHVSFGHYSLPSSFPLQSTNRKQVFQESDVELVNTRYILRG